MFELNFCPVCSWQFKGNLPRMIPYPTKRGEAIAHKPDQIFICDNCGIGIAIPLPSSEEMEKYYSVGDFWGIAQPQILAPKKHPIPYALALSRWRILEPFLKESQRRISILDIGAGHGFLGMTAAQSKTVKLWKYVCVEKDRFLRESMKKTWSLRFPHIELDVKDDISQVNGTFDCLILSHILEHLSNPLSDLKIMLTKLNPESLIFIDVPNQDYLFKKDVFPHFYFFSESSLRHLMNASGLHILSITGYGNDINQSSLNFRNAGKLKTRLGNLIIRMKWLLPKKLTISLFSEYFAMDKKNENGIWIRGVGQS